MPAPVLTDINKIKINPDNPRLIKDDKFKKLVKSIQDFPQMLSLRPIVVNNEMVVLGGNMRLKACQEAGMKKVPVIKAEELTEEQQKEFIIKDNIGFGEWDWDTIANEWDTEQLTDWGLDIPSFVNQGEAVEDDYEIPDEIETDIVLGDLFEIGPHRLFCGDSTKADDVGALMGSTLADAVVTSPPYNQSVNNFKPSGMQKESPAFVNRMAGSYKDDKDEGIYQKEQMAMLELIKLHLNNHASIFYNHKIRYRKKSVVSPFEWLSKTSLRLRQEIIWDRGSSITMNAKMFIPADERIYWMTLSESFIFNDSTEIKSWTNIWKIAPKNDVKISAAFALEIPFRCIKACTAEGNAVIDPYCGSGTTMVAAHQLNRKCYGMEIDPKYCQVIVDRMRKLDPGVEVKKNGQKLDFN